MGNIENNPDNHSNRIDRNRAILLSRDLLELNDWVIISCKLSCKSSAEDGNSVSGDAAELISLAVIGPAEQVLLDVLVRPDGAVNSELLRMHGCDPAHTFNAPPFFDIHKILKAGFSKTRIICWNSASVKEMLSKLCSQEKLPELKANYVDLQSEFSSFVGEKNDSEDAYKLQDLPPKSDAKNFGVTPLTECKCMLALLQGMAGSSQSSDAAIFNKNWSAAFYKPKLGPARMIKDILGIDE